MELAISETSERCDSAAVALENIVKYYDNDALGLTLKGVVETIRNYLSQPPCPSGSFNSGYITLETSYNRRRWAKRALTIGGSAKQKLVRR